MKLKFYPHEQLLLSPYLIDKGFKFETIIVCLNVAVPPLLSFTVTVTPWYEQFESLSRIFPTDNSENGNGEPMNVLAASSNDCAFKLKQRQVTVINIFKHV